MEDYEIDIMVGQGPQRRSRSSCRSEKIHVDRRHHAFGLADFAAARSLWPYSRLDFYDTAALSAHSQTFGGDPRGRAKQDGIAEIAARSRGTPRIANRLLRRVRDYAQVKSDGTITKAMTGEALQMLEVDRLGLDKMDTMLLLTLIDKFAGGPVGVETLAAAIGEEKDTIEDVYEPFLIQAGFIQRTPRGRVATVLAFDHFGREQSGAAGSVAKKQPSLF